MTSRSVQAATVPPPSSVNTSSSPVDLVIESMRGLAALWVFLFHLSDPIRKSIPSLHAFASEGYRGVPIFFAISGYCIFAAAQNAMARPGGASGFLARRLRRIFPTFWVSILVVMLMPFVLELVSAFKSGQLVVPSPAWLGYSAVDWLGVAFLGKELIDTATGGSGAYTALNTVYWSLAIEVQFYLVVFVAILLGRYGGAFLACVSLFGVLALLFGIFDIPGLFLRYWPGFLCGVLVRLAHTMNLTPEILFGRRQLSMCALLLGIIGLASALFAAHGDIGFTGSAAIASAVIWCLGGFEHVLSRVSVSPQARKISAFLLLPFVMLGHSSYSLYLLHGKVHQLPDMIARQILPATSPLYVLAIVVMTCLMCYAFYYLVERRFQSRRLAAPGTGTAPMAPSGVPSMIS